MWSLHKENIVHLVNLGPGFSGSEDACNGCD